MPPPEGASDPKEPKAMMTPKEMKRLQEKAKAEAKAKMGKIKAQRRSRKKRVEEARKAVHATERAKVTASHPGDPSLDSLLDDIL